jgi:nicotinamidase-related amidase
MPLPLPAHYARGAADRLERVRYEERAAEARAFAAAHGIRPAADDRRRVGLLLIDVQNTFCLPGFELFVGGRTGRGAVDDSGRICEFLYRNLDVVTEVVATLDTHSALQIFHPVFWVDPAGNAPAPHTVVGADDVARGRYRVNPAVARALGMSPAFAASYARHYVRRLEGAGKYPLTVWPYHAMLGGVGHALVAAVEEAVFFHSVARSSPTRFELKGSHPLTENYSALAPEVGKDHRGRSLVGRNRTLVDRLLGFDALVIAGQAKSHCVAWTVEDLRGAIEKRDPRLAERVYLLEDCTSAVCVEGVVDYTDAADQAFVRFAKAGMRVVRSTDEVRDWPGFSSRALPGARPAGSKRVRRARTSRAREAPGGRRPPRSRA